MNNTQYSQQDGYNQPQQGEYNGYSQQGGYNGQPQQGGYNGYPQQGNPQNPYYTNYPDQQQSMDEQAKTIKYIGIGCLASSILFLFCCSCVAPIVGVVGIMKARKLDNMVDALSPQVQKDLKTGKILCFVGICISVLMMIVNFILSNTLDYDSMIDTFVNDSLLGEAGACKSLN